MSVRISTSGARRHRFFTWYRILGLTVALLLFGSTVIYLHGPDELRAWFYPISYQSQIAQASADHQVSPYLIAAVIECESGWDSDAISSQGAVGLMQVLPSTAQEMADANLVDTSLYPVANLSDPAVNIQYGTAYLRFLIEHYGELEPAIAAYNAGMGNVDTWIAGGQDIRDVVAFPETSHYLLRVVRAKEAYEQIYPDIFPEWSSS
jgi:soluble lytic murein transglycosylase